MLRLEEEQVVRTYADMVYRIAFRYTGSRTDADDVFSEVFLAYFRKKRTFESEEHRKAWLIRVAINCAKDILGQRTPYAELNPEIAADDRSSASVELRLDLKRAIEQLSPEYREVICLFYLEQLSVRETAEVLGRKESTVKVQLSRAREKLRILLDEQE